MGLSDVQLISGEEVTVLTPSTTYDGHMDEVTTWDEQVVENVVVAPMSTVASNVDVDDTTRPHATQVELSLGFPKTFSAPLRGCRVRVRGREYAVIGDPQPNSLANCPTPWWYTASVKVCDG